MVSCQIKHWFGINELEFCTVSADALFDHVFLYINILKCYLCNLKFVKEKMEIVLKEKIKEAVKIIYNSEVTDDLIQIQETRKDFKGDFTLVVFPLLRFSKNTPEKTGETIGNYLIENFPAVSGFNVIKGFLNLEISDAWWIDISESWLLKKIILRIVRLQILKQFLLNTLLQIQINHCILDIYGTIFLVILFTGYYQAADTR